MLSLSHTKGCYINVCFHYEISLNYNKHGRYIVILFIYFIIVRSNATSVQPLFIFIKNTFWLKVCGHPWRLLIVWPIIKGQFLKKDLTCFNITALREISKEMVFRVWCGRR